MGGVGGVLIAKGLNTLVGNAMGYGPLLGNQHLFPDDPVAAAAPSPSSGKSGLTSSLTGSSYNPGGIGGSSFKQDMSAMNSSTGAESAGGKEGMGPDWNKGAEGYKPIVLAQAGPDLRGYFRHGPQEK